MMPVKFYLLTDTHYFENDLGAEGKAYEDYMQCEQYFLKESSAIVKSTFSRIMEDKETDIVIIPGDLTKNGEKESHKSFIKELYRLRESGKRIFVITAGHDYNNVSYAYKNDIRVEVEGAHFNELHEMYRDFGYGDAIAFDEPTHSYVAQITDKVRMLAICCDSEHQPKGAMDERLLDWAKAQLDKAKKDGCSVFAICHYPIIPSVPVFDLVEDARLKNWRSIASFLADNGVELALTGHMHIQSINEFYSDKGNRLIDVCTACLVGSPAKYRKITVNEDSVLKIETIPVEDFGWDMNGLSTQEYFYRQFYNSIITRVNRALDGGDGFAGHLKAFAKKRLQKLRAGTIRRLLLVRGEKSLDDKKVIDLIGEIGVGIFMGDGIHTKGTPLHNLLATALDKYSFIIKKIEPKLKKNGAKINLKNMLLDTIGNNKGFSDNNAEFKLK